MKSLLFTGASGFLGENTLSIIKNSYDVDTLGFSDFDAYRVDLSKEIPVLSKKYDIVFHAAGKAHVVPKTDAEKKRFYEINYDGTINLCSSLEASGIPSSLVFISTVAVYGCESGVMINEDHPLDGNTPYAESKKMAELFLTKWCKEHNVVLTILRPSLLAGKNPPGNLGEMMKGINTGRYLSICGGKAKKSVFMASDIAALLPLCENKGGVYNLADSKNPTVRDLELIISKQLGKKPPMIVPYWIAFCLAKVGDCLGKKAPFNSLRLCKITTDLTFSNSKLINELHFSPSDVLSTLIIL